MTAATGLGKWWYDGSGYRLVTWLALAMLLFGVLACSKTAVEDPRLLRNPTVPIGAITRFDPARFDGAWIVDSTAGGTWHMRSFRVSGSRWQEQVRTGATRTATTESLGPGVLRILYDDQSSRDVWVVWIDPDHQTAALGDPEGAFGFVATKAGKRRADQVRAAEQVLDFNGYRTDTWTSVQ
ncbi:MAG: hypothetical protein AB3N09_02480 [Tateyamaria sp.]